MVMMKEMTLHTAEHFEFVDITEHLRKLVHQDGVQEGICVVYVPHTTAAVTINENADPSVKDDILSKFIELVPWKENYTHVEGNSAAHVLSTIVGVSETIPIHNGELMLGRWQGIYFCEFDGPRTRQVVITLLEGGKQH